VRWFRLFEEFLGKGEILDFVLGGEKFGRRFNNCFLIL
jgi:hypothetical protein